MKLIVFVVCGLYAWSFAAQYVRRCFVEQPLPNPVAELIALHDVSLREIRDYTLWVNGQLPESVVQADAEEVRRRRDLLRVYLH